MALGLRRGRKVLPAESRMHAIRSDNPQGRHLRPRRSKHMTTFRAYWLSAAALLWAGLATLSMAIPAPQQSAETAAQPALAPSAVQETSLPRLQETASLAINGPFANPFVAFGSSAANPNLGLADGETVSAAPAAYPAAPPAPPPSSSSWAPTHFEI